MSYQTTERNFRRFEHHIEAFLRDYPVSHPISPQEYGLAPATIVGRVRDALLYWRKRGWSSKADFKLFLEHSYDIIVTSDKDGMVYIADRNVWRQKEANETSGEATARVEFNLGDIEVCNQAEVIRSIGALCHHRLLPQGAIIKNASGSLAPDVLQPFDVYVEQISDGVYIIN